jgi:hypothetical protein
MGLVWDAYGLEPKERWKKSGGTVAVAGHGACTPTQNMLEEMQDA